MGLCIANSILKNKDSIYDCYNIPDSYCEFNQGFVA